ncbi:P-loop containing nucleoside triphosphate hydrolase protein [Cyathus striatus]|nr:P-loop containing nucleoside triphosphate hydrolase protein [Cyathus striatus]
MTFANAHNFMINNPQMIETQNIYHQPKDEPLSPLQTSAPCTSQNFIGQEMYLERLHEHFSQAIINERKMFLLYGMGGIGKTQICLKFNDEKAGQYAYTFWIDATSEDTIIQDLKEIYKKYSSAGTTASSFSAPEVLNWISNLQVAWFIIFDNADGSPELVEKFLPSGNKGNILITSRNPALSRITTHKNSMEVSEMSKETAVDLLFNTSGINENSEEHVDKANIIVQKLHYLPLAIDMAGAYITQTQDIES